MDSLRLENLFTLMQKRALLDAVCASIHDLATSKPTFERDWDHHFRVAEQIRVNLERKRYDRWASGLAAKYERGKEARSHAAPGG
jgi:hypothetical protein